MSGWYILACVILAIFLAFMVVVSVCSYKHECELDERREKAFTLAQEAFQNFDNLYKGYLKAANLCEQLIKENRTLRSIIDDPNEYLRKQEEDGNI